MSCAAQQWHLVADSGTTMTTFQRSCSVDNANLCLWSRPSCPCLPLERCYRSPSSERSESCDSPSAPARRRRCCWASRAAGWQAAGLAGIDPMAGRPSPGRFLGWALMRSELGAGCWPGLACNGSKRTLKCTHLFLCLAMLLHTSSQSLNF